MKTTARRKITLSWIKNETEMNLIISMQRSNWNSHPNPADVA
jgi:hypothetical protein